MMRTAAVACWLLGACAGAPLLRAPSSAPPLRPPSSAPPAALAAEDSAGSATFAPSGEPAARYNDAPPPIPPTPFDDAVAAVIREAVRQAGRLPVPVADPRLFAACADLAEIIPEHRGLGATLATSTIEFALERHGIIESQVWLVFGWGQLDTPAQFVDQLLPKLVAALHDDPASRFGVGVAQRRPDGIAAIVFALQSSSISTLPIPRVVAADADIEIDAVIDSRYRDPEVFVTRDDGRTRQLDLRSGRPGGFVAQIACDDRIGRQQIEITGNDAAGATVLANFPVWCGTAPPSSIRFDPEPEEPADSPEQAERCLLDSVNRDRAAAGLPELGWDHALAEVARSYSEEMRRTHLVAHISPITGSVADRVRAAQITVRVVLENVARASGAREVHRALMSSPAHRANLMSTEVTRIGIGVVFGDEIAGRRDLFITQVFTSAPPSPMVRTGWP
jgi:uncharacterized protein YkwD